MVCFVRVSNHLYDLDSMATQPQCVGECGDQAQLQTMAMDQARVYMDRYMIGRGRLDDRLHVLFLGTLRGLNLIFWR